MAKQKTRSRTSPDPHGAALGEMHKNWKGVEIDILKAKTRVRQTDVAVFTAFHGGVLGLLFFGIASLP